MKPVMQTILTMPGGNCFQACVASIFELSLDEVPHFMGDSAGDAKWTDDQWKAVRTFAHDHSAEALWLDPATDREALKDLVASGSFYIAIGPAPVGQFGHCVVMCRGEYVHDPLPGRQFLKGDPWTLIFFQAGKQSNLKKGEETSVTS